jgi:hypothetical protein
MHIHQQSCRLRPASGKRGPRFVEANVSQTHVFAVNGRTYSSAEGGELPIEVSYELESDLGTGPAGR